MKYLQILSIKADQTEKNEVTYRLVSCVFLSKIPGGRWCNCISDKYLRIRRKFSTLNKGQSWDAYKVINQMTSGINSVLKCSLRIV